MIDILTGFETDHLKENGYQEQDVVDFTEDLRKWMKKNHYVMIKEVQTKDVGHNKFANLFNFNL